MLHELDLYSSQIICSAPCLSDCELCGRIIQINSEHSLKIMSCRYNDIIAQVDFKLGRTHEKQLIRRSESTSAKREWIWIYESTVFECVLRLNTPQTSFFYEWVSCSWYIWDEIAFNNYIDLCIIIIETLPLFPSYITYQLYKYILWTWTNLSYYINTFIAHYCIRLYNVYTSIYIWRMYIQPWQKLLNHYEVLWILISTFNHHCLLKISILCCCYLLFVNIIPNSQVA